MNRKFALKIQNSRNNATKRRIPLRRMTPVRLSKNPPSFEAMLTNTMSLDLKDRIIGATSKGVLGIDKIMSGAFATPSGMQVNCYAFFLTAPAKEWTARIHKSQPGDKCDKPSAKTPLAFENRLMVSNQLIERVLCDNPGVLHFLKPGRNGYHFNALQMKLPKGYVLGCCIVGGSDYHFLRREGIDELLQNQAFRDIWRKENKANVKEQLERLRNDGHLYCWSHVAGWSSRLKLVDADGHVIVNPADKKPVMMTKDPSKQWIHNRANHSYGAHLHYDHFVGLFIVKARAATLPMKNKLPKNLHLADKQMIEHGITPKTIKRMRRSEILYKNVPHTHNTQHKKKVPSRLVPTRLVPRDILL